ncbi:hypothetical protein GDO86_020340 [Hymenochirus boettgeri]|uniref:Uncharacterized protein n=1 Tax=Hymenochirus boettgeri TaxID=247094 RepID=A0A8T2IEY8_9PIPI|nr:hypothetical protein GDO86_020340 [Hymenochirus boettgeri]
MTPRCRRTLALVMQLIFSFFGLNYVGKMAPSSTGQTIVRLAETEPVDRIEWGCR